MKFILNIITFIIYLSLIGCSEEQKTLPKTENETLNKILDSAPSYSLIPIDGTPVDTVFADGNNTITLQSRESQTILGRVTGLTSWNDSLYVADQQNSIIWRVNEGSGNLRTYGRRGNGPGEFEMLMGIAHNSSSLISVEPAKIQIFNRNMTIKHEISQVVYGEKLAVSDKHLFIALNPNTNNELIQVRESTHPFDEVARIMNPIIPTGFQPAAYNSIEIAANSNGYLAITYNGLPYLFIFNPEFEIEHVLYFQFENGESLDNPSPKPIRNTEPMRVSAFISNLKLLDDKTIYFTNSMNVYKIVLNVDNYRIDKRMHFSFADPEKREETPWGLQATSLHVQNDIMYVGSIFDESIYRFEL